MVPLNGSDLEDLLLMMSFFQNWCLEVESVDLVIHPVDLSLVRSCLQCLDLESMDFAEQNQHCMYDIKCYLVHHNLRHQDEDLPP